MFIQEFTQPGLLTRVTVRRDTAGWQLREEQNGAVVTSMHYTDWHRLERALRTIALRHPDRDVTLKVASV